MKNHENKSLRISRRRLGNAATLATTIDPLQRPTEFHARTNVRAQRRSHLGWSNIGVNVRPINADTTRRTIPLQLRVRRRSTAIEDVPGCLELRRRRNCKPCED